MAKRLGIAFQQLQKNEKGANRISAGRLFRMAVILEVPVTYFFEDIDLSDEQPPKGRQPALLSLENLLTPESVRLLEAFAKIKNPKLRKTLVELIVQNAKTASDERDAD